MVYIPYILTFTQIEVNGKDKNDTESDHRDQLGL